MNSKILDSFMMEMFGILKDVKTFSATQIPEVAQQVVKYEFWHGFFVSVFSAIILIVTICGYRKMKASHAYDDSENYFFGHVVLSSLGPISAVVLLVHIDSMIKISLAPKLYLIEYFSQLIRNRN